MVTANTQSSGTGVAHQILSGSFELLPSTLPSRDRELRQSHTQGHTTARVEKPGLALRPLDTNLP